jgi:two-component system LytT family response regulator
VDDAEPDLRVLLVDDEPLARELLRHLLTGSGATVIGECSDGLQAIEAIRLYNPDLVFLDIEMPGLGGFEVVEAIGPDAMPPVVFVTAHAEHALRAFELHALDYVLKPLSSERFTESFRVARSRLGRDPEATRLALRAVLAERGRTEYRRRFLVRRRDRLVVIDAAEVDLIEAAGNYVRLECGDQAALFRATVASLERELDPTQFLRIHRSLIVRVDRVKSLERDTQGDLLAALRSGRRVPVQRRYSGPLRLALGA